MIIGGFQHIDVTGLDFGTRVKIEGIYNTIKNCNGKPVVLHNFSHGSGGIIVSSIMCSYEVPLEENANIILYANYGANFTVDSNDVIAETS